MDPSFYADGPPIAYNPEEYRTLSTLPIKPGTWSYQPYNMVLYDTEHKNPIVMVTEIPFSLRVLLVAMTCVISR